MKRVPGLVTRRDLEFLINRASERSIDDTLPDISEIWDPKSKMDSVNEGHTGYKRVVVPIEPEKYDNMHDFELGIIPIKESRLAHSDWNEFQGPPRDVIRAKLEPEIDRAGRRLGSKLRHRLGKLRVPRGKDDPTLCEGLRCDEGYWVNLPEVFRYGHIWDPLGLQYNYRTSNRTEKMEVFRRKLGIIMLCNPNEFEWSHRLRYHIMGLKIRVSKLKEKPQFMARHGIDLTSEKWGNPHDDSYIWLMPLAVRATMGHSPRKGGTSFTIDFSTATRFWGAFHVTDLESFKGIRKSGLTPGGPRGGRVNSFFYIFAPWDDRSWRLTKTTNKTFKSPKVVLYLNCSKFLKYSFRISSDGQLLTAMVIPFEDFDATWILDNKEKKHDWVRLAVPDVSPQLILSAKECYVIADWKKMDEVIGRTLVDTKSLDPGHIREIISYKQKHLSGEEIIEPADDKWNRMVSLLAWAYVPKESGMVLCPGCLDETPKETAWCLQCYSTLMSYGFMKVLPPASHDIQETSSSLGLEEIDPEITMEDFVEDERTKAANSPVEPESDEEMPDLDNRPPAAADDDADIEVDDDKPDNMEATHMTEIQGMKIEVRSGITIPKWLKLYEWGVESLTAEGAICMDKFPLAPEIMDLIWGKWVTSKYTKALSIFIRGDKDAIATCFEDKHWDKRIDLNEPVPYNGLDEDGMLLDPTEQQHKDYHHHKYVVNGKEENSHRFEFEGYMQSYKMNLICQKMILYCIRCGITHRELKDMYNIDPEDKNFKMTEEVQNERRKEAHQKLLEQKDFTRQLFRGALGINKYSYFRPEIEISFQDAIYIDPHALLIAIPKPIRLIAALHVCKNYGVQLHPLLDKQLRNAIAQAQKNKDGLIIWGALLDRASHKAVMDHRQT